MKGKRTKPNWTSIGSQAINLLVVVSILISVIPAPVAADVESDATITLEESFNTSDYSGTSTETPTGVGFLFNDNEDFVIMTNESQYAYDGGDGTWTGYSSVNSRNSNPETAVVTDRYSFLLDGAKDVQRTDWNLINSPVNDATAGTTKDIEEMREADNHIITMDVDSKVVTYGQGLGVSGSDSFAQGTCSVATNSSGYQYISWDGDSCDNYAINRDDGSGSVGSGAGQSPKGIIETQSLNQTGNPSDTYVGTSNGWVQKLDLATSGSQGFLWNTSISGNPTITASEYEEQKDVVAVGDSNGDVTVLNQSDGSVVKTLEFADNSQIQSIDSENGKIIAVQADGSVRIWNIQEPGDVESIDLQIDDDTLLNGQKSNYDVIGTREDSSTIDVTSSSNTAVDDSNVVSVDEVNTELNYQGDGTTIVRSNYTNATGQVLWSNKSIETDTPTITLQVSDNPITESSTGNYTVLNETFGTSTNVSLSASVVSGDTNNLTIDETNLEYTSSDIDVDSVDVEVTATDGAYSDSINITIERNSTIVWDNWNNLQGGERMILIGSDWTFIYLFGSIIVASLVGFYFKAPRLGTVSFGGLSIIGWPLGFIPNYVALTVVIFLAFMFFIFDFEMSNIGGFQN